VNILRKPSLPQRVATLAAIAACMAPCTPLAQQQDFANATSARLRAADLECDRISARSRVDPDFMTTYTQVGEVLRDRDFGGDFERLLQWWRGGRDASRAQLGEAGAEHLDPGARQTDFFPDQ
jgi:hypothetical protein